MYQISCLLKNRVIYNALLMFNSFSRAAWRLGLLISVCFLSFYAPAQQVDSQLYNGLRWRMIGPFRGGRSIAVSGVESQPNVFYFGAVGGGVWKSDNAGETWRPIFDSEPTQSIGALAVSQSNPDVIYVGTGEADFRSDLTYGNGVFKSTDTGKTWTNIGLRDSRHKTTIPAQSISRLIPTILRPCSRLWSTISARPGAAIRLLLLAAQFTNQRMAVSPGSPSLAAGCRRAILGASDLPLLAARRENAFTR